MKKPAKKPRVTFIHPHLGKPGPAELFILNIAVALAQHGCNVTFFTDKIEGNSRVTRLQNKVAVRILSCWFPASILGLFKGILGYIRMLFLTLMYLVKYWRNKFSEETFVISRFPLVIPILKCTGARVVYYCRPFEQQELRAFKQLRMLYYFHPSKYIKVRSVTPDTVIVNSNYSASVLLKNIQGISNVQVLYPKIPTVHQELIEKSLANKKSFEEIDPQIVLLPTETFVFLAIGSYYPENNLELAINAFEVFKFRLREQDWPSVHLILAGEYDDTVRACRKKYAELLQLVVKSQVDLKVTFLKSPTNEVIIDLLQACHCVIYTTTGDDIGNFALLAIASAKPLITCTNSGSSEAVIHRITGYLCQATPHSIAECMYLTMKVNSPLMMGLEGNQHYKQHFASEVFIKNVKLIFGNSPGVSPIAVKPTPPSKIDIHDEKSSSQKMPAIEEIEMPSTSGQKPPEAEGGFVDDPKKNKEVNNVALVDNSLDDLNRDNEILDYNLQLGHEAFFRLD